MKLAPKRQNVIKSSVNMTDNAYRKLYYSFKDEEMEASKNGETFVNFLAIYPIFIFRSVYGTGSLF